MKKIVLVGQTPPPFGGQAIMIEKILQGKYIGIHLFHVRMSFSKEMDEIGKFRFSKIVYLFHVIFKIYYYRLFKNANVLYYPPAGPDKIPVLRDIIILIATRWVFRKTIFHFHAGGVSEMKISSRVFRWFYKLAYCGVDCAILLSELNPPDGKNLGAKESIIIPYGIEDSCSIQIPKTVNTIVKIIFVGVVKESKGILVLLKAGRQLKEQGLDFKIEIMGKFESEEFQKRVIGVIKENDLEDQISFLGVLSGKRKSDAFINADIFCFPTFFESETFGVVLLEAMQFSLPIVSTLWRGIPSIIEEGKNGFLVEPKNAEALANKMSMLIRDESLRNRMGKFGREIFLSKYTLNEFHSRIGQIFVRI